MASHALPALTALPHRREGIASSQTLILHSAKCPNVYKEHSVHDEASSPQEPVFMFTSNNHEVFLHYNRDVISPGREEQFAPCSGTIAAHDLGSPWPRPRETRLRRDAGGGRFRGRCSCSFCYYVYVWMDGWLSVF